MGPRSGRNQRSGPVGPLHVKSSLGWMISRMRTLHLDSLSPVENMGWCRGLLLQRRKQDGAPYGYPSSGLSAVQCKSLFERGGRFPKGFKNVMWRPFNRITWGSIPCLMTKTTTCHPNSMILMFIVVCSLCVAVVQGLYLAPGSPAHTSHK